MKAPESWPGATRETGASGGAGMTVIEAVVPEKPPSGGTRKRVIQLTAVVLAIGVLIWLLDRIGWPTITAALHSIGVKGALLLGAIALTESALDGAALWTIAGPSLRFGFVVAVNCAGSVLNLVLPWESGEVLKGGLLGTHFRSENAISATVIWNYVFKISRPVVSALAAIIAWILCPYLGHGTMAVIVLANIAAFLPYAALRFVIRLGAAAGFLRILRFIPGIRRHPSHWIDLARNIDLQIQGFWRDRPSDYMRVFTFQALARTTGWASIYACFRLLHLPYTFGQATLLYAAMNVTDYLVAVLPARVGVSESAAFFVFRLLGMEPSMGVIIFLILRLRTIAANGLIAPLAFLDWRPRAP
jgi:hypothetical protein